MGGGGGGGKKKKKKKKKKKRPRAVVSCVPLPPAVRPLEVGTVR